MSGHFWGEAPTISVERQPAAGGSVPLGDVTAGLAARHKTYIFEAVDRRLRENGISLRHRSTIDSVSRSQ